MNPFSRLQRSRSLSISRASFIEPLEQRTMLNATVTSTIAPLSVSSSAATTTLNLNTYFNDPDVTGTAVEIETPQGNIPIALTNSATPKTVANFLSYISSGAFSSAIIHRSVPGFVIQGGGFLPDGEVIPTTGTVPEEPGISNTTGTIAMALSSGPNSGSDEWFINLANNNTGGTDLDDSSDGGPFTVFGNVIYNGLTVANAIAALQIVDDSAQNGAFNALPVETNPGSSTPSSVPAADMVTTDTVVVPALTYTVSSNNTALVNPSISGGTLSMAYGAGTGVAQITVTATDLGGHTAINVFNVDVGGTNVTIGQGNPRTLRFTDPNGTASVVSLAGPGTASVSFTGSGLTESTARGVITEVGTPTSVSINATGTTAGSILSITAAGVGSTVSLAGITTTGSIGIVSARKVALNGDLTVAGNAGSIVLGSATGGSISVGGDNSVGLDIVGASTDDVSAPGNIRSLKAASWASGDINTASTISAVNIAGSLGASISAARLGAARAGAITGGTWTVAGTVLAVRSPSISDWTASLGDLGALSTTNIMTDSTLRTDGSIGSVVVNGMSHSNIYVGLAALPDNTVPTTTDGAFDSSIGAVLIGSGGFTASNIAAADKLRSVFFTGSVTTSNGGTPFGFAAGEIVSLVANAGGTKKLRLHAATTAAQVTAAEIAAGVSPQDFTIAFI